MRNFVGCFAFVALMAACTAQNPDDAGGIVDGGFNPLAADAEAELSAVEGESVDRADETTVDGPQEPILLGSQTDGISKSNDFETTINRATIESDAARLAELKKQYKVIEPEALPNRGSTVNLAKYAVDEKQNIGEATYRRYNVDRLSSRLACRRYKTADDAQRAFLRSGGPGSDRLKLDPDGDGFACAWDPTLYRRLFN